MRIISGTGRGRKLKELPGLDTRPTTDRVKESIFNIIQFDIEGRRILDLFGGTGQMGIEALSRGAAAAVFCDTSAEPVGIIRENLSVTGYAPLCEVYQRDAIAYLMGKPGKFDVVFLDPPYASDLLESALNAIAVIDIVSENGIIVCESSLESVLPQLPAPYEMGKQYRYGKIKVTLYRRMAK
ncbi:MAG: 16S rRNA (guanine(966)-N(2))-methyltransferase RsmD [Oscillospiraceae bacterium]